MPMTAEQLATIIDQVWEEASAHFAIPPRLLNDALDKSRMFDKMKTFEVFYRDQQSVWARGLLIGIHVGKAIREVEELEGLGR